MAEIDPITQEALRRASRMYSRPKSRSSESRPPESAVRKEKPPERFNTPKPEKPSEHKAPPISDPFKAFFRDKEESVILLLVLLLMDENADPSLLLALMYLLI